MLDLEQVNSLYGGVLQEIANIGSGNATTAVANMLGLRMNMSVPQVEFIPVEEIGTSIGGEENIVVGIFLEVELDIEGSLMFIMDMSSARHLVNRLMMRPSDYEAELDEMDLSAIKEMGNIIASSYLTAIATLTNMTISPSVPYIAVDMAAAILNVPAVQFGMMGDKALIIKTDISDEVDISGYFILMPEGDSYDKILSALGIPI